MRWIKLTLRPEVQEDYNYHFPCAGPLLPFHNQVYVVQGFENRCVFDTFDKLLDENREDRCDPKEFGKFLHMLADSWSHGGGMPDLGGHPKGVPIFDDKGKLLTGFNEEGRYKGYASDEMHLILISREIFPFGFRLSASTSWGVYFRGS